MALTTVPVELANLDGAVTVNESSADVDFRIESNGNANMLFVNGGNDQVGVGADPSALFHVTHGGGGFDEVARLTSVANSSGDGAFLGFHGNSTSKFYGFIGGYDIGTNEGGIKIGVGNGETAIADSMTKMTIDNDGKVTITSASSFSTALEIKNTADTHGSVITFNNDSESAADGDYIGGLIFQQTDDASNAYTYAKIFGIATDVSNGSEDGALAFETGAAGANTAERMRISSTGSISMPGLGSGAGNADLRFNTGNGDVTYDTSSRFVKENIEDIPYGLEAVKNLSPKKYKRTDGDKEVEVGFIADEVVEVVPELVGMMAKSVFTKEESDTDEIAGSVNYSKMTAVLVKAIQEQQALIETLQTKVKALEEA